jgi:DNA-binding NtrC family response regulator
VYTRRFLGKVLHYAQKSCGMRLAEYLPNREERTPVTHVPTIIVIDDQTGLQGLLCRILLDEGYSVRTAAQRSLALRILDERQPAIILMDWRHDGISGMSARQFVDIVHSKYSDVDFIVTTTHAEAAEAASDIGIRHVLRKPFQVDEMLSVVGNCAAGVAKAS